VSLPFHVRLAGVLLLALAAVHLAFPRRFQWKEELGRLSLINRQIFVVHVIFICVILVLMGSLSLFAAGPLLEPTPLARLVLAGFAAFWALRLVFQWFVYDRALWRGNALHTGVHLGATALWAYFTGVYGVAFFSQA
jgi:hypothetical protein